MVYQMRGWCTGACIATALVFGTASVVGEDESHAKLSFSQKVDQIFAPFDKSDAPGCAVGIIENGVFLHKAGYGMASLELDVPLSPDSVFRIASVSKQFTAAAVLLLEEDGLIDLDADIRTYLPALPEYEHTVTVRAMLGHYSGLQRYAHIAGSYEGAKSPSNVNMTSPMGRPFRIGNEDYLTNGEFYEAVKMLQLNHKPDEKFEYNNVGYFLLSQLVEARTGKTLREFAHERIFEPLGMTNTFYSDDPVEIIKNRAQGYKPKKDGGYISDMTNLFVVGDGGVHTSINDFIKWDQNFYAPKLGKDPAAFKAKMNTPTSNHKAGSRLYAYGQFVSEQEGRTMYSHGGGWLGTSTYYIRDEGARVSLVTLCNNAAPKGLRAAHQAVIELYFSQAKKQ